jgi:23S rRNA-/tRNA-specific pseudouridylate synthase
MKSNRLLHINSRRMRLFRQSYSLLSSLVAKDAQLSSESVARLAKVTILQQTPTFLVADKPPAVVCHHSDYTGSRAREEVPMLQRVRDTVDQRVNLVHRLDRGASGCLLFAFDPDNTALLSEAMSDATKTYIALVRGEGILKGRDFKQEGWFKVDRPIKDVNGG